MCLCLCPLRRGWDGKIWCRCYSRCFSRVTCSAPQCLAGTWYLPDLLLSHALSRAARRRTLSHPDDQSFERSFSLMPSTSAVDYGTWQRSGRTEIWFCHERERRRGQKPRILLFLSRQATDSIPRGSAVFRRTRGTSAREEIVELRSTDFVENKIVDLSASLRDLYATNTSQRWCWRYSTR